MEYLASNNAIAKYLGIKKFQKAMIIRRNEVKLKQQ